MGCIFTKPERNGRHRKIFRVYNVDEHGEELNHGKIEVTDSDLILYHRQKEIRWPLRCLRRYGWEEELFSFESGRRCATGPGIFAFKCQRAEVLFNTVQESIRRAGQSEQSVHHVENTHNNSRPPSMIEIPDFQNRNGNHSNGNPHLPQMSMENYVNQVTVDSRSQYANTMPPANATQSIFDILHMDVPQPSQPVPQPNSINYTDLVFTSSDDSLCNNDNSPEPEEGSPVNTEDVFLDDNVQNYVNVQPDKQPARPPPPVLTRRDTNGMTNYSNQSSLTTMDQSGCLYITVDTGSVSAPVAPAPPAPVREQPPTYAVIDIAKSEALQNTQRDRVSSRWEENDNCSRKTRHNSTFD
ncbi:uncharacterized protein LOC133185492 [Saccostrea echinata]|uniref:uncharacterized protein LOC133185492 n=1 Tax=Saccostrea echinata TaxID=191078 RepID=UPI002A839E1F|nr:uncharacterized protein LOC133185492 [Saccostrea echinata]